MQTATPADCRPDWLIRAHSPKSAMAVHSFGKTPNVSNELALLIRTPVAINERLMTLSVPLASRFMTVYLCLCPDTYIRGDCKVPPLHSLFRWTCSDKLSKSARDFFYDGQNTWVNYWTAWIQVSHSSRTNTSVSTHSLSWWYSFISWRDWRSKGTEGTKLSVLTIFLLRSLRMVKLTTRHIHHFP